MKIEETKIIIEDKEIPLLDVIAYVRKEIKTFPDSSDEQIGRNILFCARQWEKMKKEAKIAK